MKNFKFCFVFAALLNGCASVTTSDNSELMYIKASPLTKLTAAVEATLRIDKPSATLSDQELLELSTKDDPELLEPFKGYILKVNKDFNHIILLVCNAEGTKGLLEDAGCTYALDKHLWQSVLPCKFTLRSENLCK